MSANADKLARNAKVHDLHREMKTSVSELVGVRERDPARDRSCDRREEMLAARERQARELGAGGGGGMAGGAGEPRRSRAGKRRRERARAATTTRDVQRFASPNGNEGDGSTFAIPRFENFMPFSAVSLGRLNPTKNDGGGGDGVFGARLLADALEEARRRGG